MARFTEVNGEKVNHFVILDATTGQIDRTWDVQVQRRNGDAAQVRNPAGAGRLLYIGGNFTHVKGNTSSSYAYARGAAPHQALQRCGGLELAPELQRHGQQLRCFR